MADKTITGLANPAWESSLVDGLFKWTDVGDGQIGDPVYLKADGPPIEVGKAGATANYIGQLASAPKQGEICRVHTKYTGIHAVVAGGTLTRGQYLKVNSSNKFIAMIDGDFVAAGFGAKAGQALQSAVADDVIYMGLGG